jgi:hypothetical protein
MGQWGLAESLNRESNIYWLDLVCFFPEVSSMSSFYNAGLDFVWALCSTRFDGIP